MNIAFFNAPEECFTKAQKIPKVNHFVTNLKFGTPLVSNKDREVDEDKQDKDLKYPEDNDKIVAFLNDILNIIDADFQESKIGMQMRVDGIILAIDDFMALALSDALKALFSMSFVFIYLNIHMQSCVLSCLGMGIIVLSFPFTVIITNGILQIKYFGLVCI